MQIHVPPTQQQRRKPTRLRIENQKIIIHYLGISETTSFLASDFVQPGALRRYRHSKGNFKLTWRILLSKLQKLCGFDESKHILASASGAVGGKGGAAALVLSDDKGFNAAFRAQIAWFKKSEGEGTVVFWALMKDDLRVRGKEIAREAFLAEAGVDIGEEDGEPGSPDGMLVSVVEAWSEGVVEEGVRGGVVVAKAKL